VGGFVNLSRVLEQELVNDVLQVEVLGVELLQQAVILLLKEVFTREELVQLVDRRFREVGHLGSARHKDVLCTMRLSEID